MSDGEETTTAPLSIKLSHGLELVPRSGGFVLVFTASDGRTFSLDVSDLACDDGAAVQILMSWAAQARIQAVMATPHDRQCECAPAEVMKEVGLDRWSCTGCGNSWSLTSSLTELQGVINTAAVELEVHEAGCSLSRDQCLICATQAELESFASE